ncbi:MAG: type I glyceraldehyde-3-phosphate dehydrogenase [Myxococcales bacterium]|nr:type I glyceraldehyde-3-phosphate dehydrogenase [Myxococcales bacterium]MCB9643688.1 type I glyceraldehyde-3-phosphate dehydrogenase [Myxococcales bacterium]
MAIRIGINGFGRIGRTVLRRILQMGNEIEVVAINDIGAPDALVHLFKYDSVMGRLPYKVNLEGGELHIEGKGSIKMIAERELTNLPWAALNVDFVVESSGVFRSRDKLEKHIAAGAPKVLLTVPSKDPIDATIVLGVNDDDLKPEHKLISNASCTTNCLAPMAKVLHEKFGIEHAMMTTIHAYTNDQRILDAPHSDPYRARAAAVNIIPTTTGAARATGEVLPALKGRIDGMAMRVPVPDGSVVDLVSVLSKEVTAADINAAMKEAAEGPLKGILEYTEDPIVSTDIIGNSHSSVFAADSTMVLGKNGRMVKTVSWYDNEFGYSCRVVDLLKKAAQL